MERSLILVKPDAVLNGHASAILNRIESKGLKLIACRMLKMDEALARKHYAPHVDKPFFPSLLTYITSAPIVAAVFEGDNAVARIREIMGPTNPANAPEGTIRKDFGENIERNAIHGSDSVENAEKEIALFFGGYEIMDY
ncbi:MAG: nucleoside-diphosphate kinase [Dehalococcoidales bacterium]|jgi:nucleoside-diphosphate kinase|nr:nucleoside-diphosphate kinase [Dehalococcoidales bacterium]